MHEVQKFDGFVYHTVGIKVLDDGQYMVYVETEKGKFFKPLDKQSAQVLVKILAKDVVDVPETQKTQTRKKRFKTAQAY